MIILTFQHEMVPHNDEIISELFTMNILFSIKVKKHKEIKTFQKFYKKGSAVRYTL